MNWKVIGVGKFSGSKETNILWQHQVSGEVYIGHLEGEPTWEAGGFKPLGIIKNNL